MEFDPNSPLAQVNFLCKRKGMLQFPETTCLPSEWYREYIPQHYGCSAVSSSDSMHPLQ